MREYKSNDDETAISRECLQALSSADFRAMLAFVAVIELKGLAPAGQALEISTATVSMHLSRFRSQYGQNLFTRTGRALEPTREAYVLARQLGILFDGLYAAMLRPLPPGVVNRRSITDIL